MNAGLRAFLVKTGKYLPSDEKWVKGGLLADSLFDAIGY